MGQFKKILVAFDGSEDGLKALDTAKTLTKDNDAELVVVYVHGSQLEHPVNIGTTSEGEQFMFQHPIASGTVIGNIPYVPSREHEVIIEEDMPKQVMSTAKAKLAGVQKVTYEKLVGKPAKKIVSYANDHDMDLIIMGNRGIGAFKKLVMGSVSEDVTGDSECSVLIVK